jgi:(R)-2-hydroxyisocaproyl-CoA dehydratase beta subunit
MNKQMPASEILLKLIHAGECPKDAITASMKSTGKDAIGCFPIYAPEEIVYAAGYLPVGMWGGQTQGSRSDMYLQSFCCSIMKANMEQALSGQYGFLSGVIITAFCDTLKCIIEDWKVALPELDIIPIVYPQNRKSKAGRVFMKEEFQRVQHEIERLSGKPVTEQQLAAAVDVYDEYRKTVREFADIVSKHTDLITSRDRHMIIKAAWFMDKKEYTDMLRTVVEWLESLDEQHAGGKKVILTGLICEPAEIYDILAENKLYVAADDLAHESRQFRNETDVSGSAVDRMVERIAEQDGCTFLYDSSKSRGNVIKELVEKYEADAVIFCQLKFCDPDEFDYPIIKKEMEAAGIPMLYLEIEQQMSSLNQTRTRIQSFAEMLAEQ